MIKKLGLSLLLLFFGCGFGFTLANPIVTDWDRSPEECYKLKNIEIDNYRVIISTKSPQKEYPLNDTNPSQDKSVYDAVLDTSISSSLKNDRNAWGFYMPKLDECIKALPSSDNKRFDLIRPFNVNVSLLDNSIDVDSLTEEEFDDNAIFIGNIRSSNCLHDHDCDVTNTYKIINSGSNYSIVLDKRENLERKHNIESKTSKFPLFWGLAVIIETLVLFFIAKMFRQEDQISNKKLLLRGVIPTTITLPLLRFVLPLIIGNQIWYIIIGEILVTAIEAILIEYGLNISRKMAIICSIICNLLSFVILSINIFDWEPIIALLVFIFVEGIILFLVGKLSREGISNKKLVLCGLITSIIDLVVMLFLSRLLEDYLDMPESLTIIYIIVIKLLVDMLTIRSLRKVSRGKTIISSILFNLCIVMIILALIYCLRLM